MMKDLLRETIALMLEVDEPKKASPEMLRNIVMSGKPYLHGKWVKMRKDYSQKWGPPSGECWQAEDPQLGPVYLTVTSSTSHKMAGRLRIPEGTRNEYRAVLSNEPWDSFGSYKTGVIVMRTVSVGEGREHVKRDQLRKKLVKKFGVDPYSYLGALEPEKKPEPAKVEPVKSGPTTITLQFYECEHEGDLDDYARDIAKSGGQEASRRLGPEESETGVITFSVADPKTFLEKFQQTSAFGFINSLDPMKSTGLKKLQDLVTPVEPATKASPPADTPSGEKTYKIYGRKGKAPAHTRLKGKAYVAGSDTKFKPGDKAVVTPRDGKLAVKDPSSDHTQVWDPEEG